MLQANSVALVTTSVPPAAVRLALGVQAAAQAAGLALGPALGGLLTAAAGWRAVYWINVPVGCAALIASRYLLPRTRQFSPAGRFDWLGTALLGLSTTCLLLALSAAAGLAIPGWAGVGLAAVAVAAGIAFGRRGAAARFPVIPLDLLRSRPLAFGLGGALCGYLVLFGPLVLIPEALPPSGSAARVGLLLTALPAGFGVAALAAEALLPAALGNRRRGALGACISTISLGILVFVPLSAAWIVGLLAVTGLGLGLFVPANNVTIMRSAPPGSAATLGGLVNMARGIGTTFGIALVTLVLHVAAGRTASSAATGPAAGSRLAFAVLALAAAAAAVLALAGPAGDRAAGAANRKDAAGASAFS